MDYRKRWPGEFDKNEKKTNTWFLVLIGVRTVDMKQKKGCPEGTQGYYFNLGWGQPRLSSTKCGQIKLKELLLSS